jgi:hypothetical protein
VVKKDEEEDDEEGKLDEKNKNALHTHRTHFHEISPPFFPSTPATAYINRK